MARRAFLRGLAVVSLFAALGLGVLSCSRGKEDTIGDGPSVTGEATVSVIGLGRMVTLDTAISIIKAGGIDGIWVSTVPPNTCYVPDGEWYQGMECPWPANGYRVSILEVGGDGGTVPIMNPDERSIGLDDSGLTQLLEAAKEANQPGGCSVKVWDSRSMPPQPTLVPDITPGANISATAYTVPGPSPYCP